ncbi:PQQ-binding-like beta-propeller repeat protein [Halomicroarcula sp. GCM10025709]|uniref:outer membrane protein assembly factor BamB family protein n=1 Tax=Halomicroarcula sp. GCM10025709 TaxID=3252669 RepID=UPI003620F800
MSDTPSRKLLSLCMATLVVAALPVAVFGPIGVGAADAGNAGNTAVDWPSFQSGQQNTGDASDAPPYDALSTGWTASGSTDIASGPAVVDGTAYVADGTTIKAVDAGTGSETWSTTVDGTVYGTPAYANGQLYVATASGTVTALNAADGSEAWSVSTDGNGNDLGAFYGSVATDGSDDLYVASKDGVLHKLAADGSGVITSTELSSQAGAMTPAVYDGSVYVGDRGGTLHALSTDLTSEFTKSVTGSGSLTSPAVDTATGTVVVTTTDGTVAAYAPDGTQVWQDTATREASQVLPSTTASQSSGRPTGRSRPTTSRAGPSSGRRQSPAKGRSARRCRPGATRSSSAPTRAFWRYSTTRAAR